MGAFRVTCATALVVLTLTGCGKQPAPQAIPSETEPTAASSTAASPSHSTSSASPTLTPEPMPEAATRPDQAGQKAFIEHWVSLYNYARLTGDTEPFMAISDPHDEGNLGLVKDLRDLYGAGAHQVGSVYDVRDIVCVPLDERSQTRPTLVLSLSEGKEISADGTAEYLAPAADESYGVLLTWTMDKWRFDGFYEI